MLRFIVVKNSKFYVEVGGRTSHQNALIHQGFTRGKSELELNSALKLFHHESHITCVENLPWLVLAFKTAVHENIRYTPDVLILVRESKGPLAVRWNLSTGSDVDNFCHTEALCTRGCGNLLAARKRVARRFNIGR